jgi:TRAP-type C4-dicarboxylate transport system permease large subunit
MYKVVVFLFMALFIIGVIRVGFFTPTDTNDLIVLCYGNIINLLFFHHFIQVDKENESTN